MPAVTNLFLSWSISLHFLLSIDLLILHTVLRIVLLIPPAPFFEQHLHVAVNMMIPLIWVSSTSLVHPYLTVNTVLFFSVKPQCV